MSGHCTPMPGTEFPPLPLALIDRGRVDLASLPGWRLLVIYRGRHCPACTKYLQTLSALHARFVALGVTVVAASSDPEARAAGEARDQAWPFHVAFDLDVAQMRALGLFVSAAAESEEADRPFAEPGLFLIEPSGVLRAIDVSNVPFSRPDLEQILEGIRSVQQAQPPVHGSC
jgi:peroxiredoxin